MLRSLLILALASSWSFGVEPIKPSTLIEGLNSPRSTAVTADGRIFVATDAGLVELVNGKPTPVAPELKSPRKMVAFQQSLYVTSEAGIHRLDLKTNSPSMYADHSSFPTAPGNLQSIVADERGTVYVADATLDQAAVYRIAAVPNPNRTMPPTRKAQLVADGKIVPGLRTASGLEIDSTNHLLIADASTGTISRLRLNDRMIETIATRQKNIGSMAFDYFGRLYFESDLGMTLFSIPRPGVAPVRVAPMEVSTGHVAYDGKNHRLLLTQAVTGKVLSIPAQVPGYEFDDSPLPLKTEIAFGKLTFSGYDNGEDSGRPIPLRPIVLTHCGDGSGRTVIATQHGVIHSVKPGDSKTHVMLDLQSKCLYKDTENEQGLLGLAFHPKFKTNGELFVFYTDKAKRFENVVVRFRMKKDDPTTIDPASEEELIRIKHKYWNHDGGTLAFGPDGLLYIVLGDGGSANDPDGHGQMTNTLLGKILRIDVDRKDPGLAYAIPKDNPFVGRADYRPEIYATGVRNPWRLSFDRKTGRGWFGDVGQNLWEEINILEKGANYGWSVRESLHPFGPAGTGDRPELTEPVWEYHHALGKSITAGFVSRGQRLPEIDGHYIYADYVTAKIWALKYDETTKRVVANRPIQDAGAPVMSFGEDEAGELYILTYSANGRSISRIVRK